MAPTENANVVILTFNDVYKLLPQGKRGGVAEFATQLRQVKKSLSPHVPIIVTLNGDFLWRNEHECKDKGALMIELCNYLEIDVAVVGNQDFNFGVNALEELLSKASFTTLASNIRVRSTGNLMANTKDTFVRRLSNGFTLGLFGLCTTSTGCTGLAGNNVFFEDETVHARRCVESLRRQNVNAIICLSHLRIADERRIARQVPDIDAILSGHDHEPVTTIESGTFIHKSGQDALWLGQVELHSIAPSHCTFPRFHFQWRMHNNISYEPNEDCRKIIQTYYDRISGEEEQILGSCETDLDCMQYGLRVQTSTMGSLVADAIRQTAQADVGIMNGGGIVGDTVYPSGFPLTPTWVSTTIPFQENTCVHVRMSASDLTDLLLSLLLKYPLSNTWHPHLSGLYATYETSCSPTKLFLYQDPNRSVRINRNAILKIAMPMALARYKEVGTYFDNATYEDTSIGVQTALSTFIRQRSPLRYFASDKRLTFIE